MRQADVIVVGGGLIGSATAWWLARGGRDVVLLEQFEAGHDRGSSHGGVRIFRFAYPEQDYVDLARRALELWRQAEDESGEVLVELTGGIDFGYQPSVARVADCLAAAGEPGTWLAPEAAGETFAGMRFTGPVFVHPNGGRCYASRSVTAFQAQAARHGATLRFGERVVAVDVEGEQGIVRTAVDEYRAAAVVVAAGAWVTKLVGERLPLPPLTVTREQPAHFRPLDAGHAWPSFIEHAADASFTTYGLLAPGEGVKLGEHMVGPVIDPDSGDRAVDDAAVQRVVAHARRYLPGVDPTPVRVETCLYTTTANEDFVIDRRGPLTVASACSGHGFKFGPATSELVARVATGEATAPARFRF